MTPDERRERILNYHRTFLAPAGANVLEDLSSVCREKRSTFVPGSTDETAFLEGGRSVMIYIRSMIAAKPDEVETPKALTEDEPDA